MLHTFSSPSIVFFATLCLRTVVQILFQVLVNIGVWRSAFGDERDSVSTAGEKKEEGLGKCSNKMRSGEGRWIE